MKTFVVSFLLLLCTISYCSAQNNTCPAGKIFKTDFTGNGKDSLFLPLYFIVRSDSIIVSANPRSNNHFMAFGIIKAACEWNTDFTAGRSNYQVMLADKEVNRPAALTIDFSDRSYHYILIQYENSEPRKFSVVPKN